MLYHVTHTKHVARIKRLGVIPMGAASNWTKPSGERYGNGEVHAFTHHDDAVRWAAKMAWEFYQGDNAKISILHIDRSPDQGGWQVDEADPLSQATAKGQWLKRFSRIDQSAIQRIEKLTTDRVRDLVTRDREMAR